MVRQYDYEDNEDNKTIHTYQTIHGDGRPRHQKMEHVKEEVGLVTSAVRECLYQFAFDLQLCTFSPEHFRRLEM